MNAHDRRSVLEAIAFGDDPEIRAAERLRALELLRELPEQQDTSAYFRRETAKLTGVDLDRALDAVAGPEIVAAALTGDEMRFPVTVGLLRRAIEARAREIADADRIERAIERAAEERALALYAARGLQEAQDALAAVEEGHEPGSESESPSEPGTSADERRGAALPPGMEPGWELEPGWPDERRSGFRPE